MSTSDEAGSTEDQQTVSSATPLAKPRRKAHLINDAKGFDLMLEDLESGHGPFAIDAERASGFRYHQKAYLIQITRADSEIFMIDPVAFQDSIGVGLFERLASLLNRASWILHAASQDLPCLEELGLHPASLFDTELAAKILGEKRVGLGALVEDQLGLLLAKEHSAVDWSTRPLQQSWLDYAALDVDVLPELHERLAAQLEVRERTDWAKQEFEHVRTAPKKPAKTERWRGLSGISALKDQRALAIARSLWEQREELAQDLDVSPGRLVPDSSIVALSIEQPRSKRELSDLKAFHGRASRSKIDYWWASYVRGKETTELPELRVASTGTPNHRSWQNRFPDADERYKACRAALATVAEAERLMPEVLISPQAVRELCFAPPQELSLEGVMEMLREHQVRPWQLALTAEPLFQALAQIGVAEAG